MTLQMNARTSAPGAPPNRGISWALARDGGLIGTDAAGWVYRVRRDDVGWVAERLSVVARTRRVGRYRFRIMAVGAANAHARRQAERARGAA